MYAIHIEPSISIRSINIYCKSNTNLLICGIVHFDINIIANINEIHTINNLRIGIHGKELIPEAYCYGNYLIPLPKIDVTMIFNDVCSLYL